MCLRSTVKAGIRQTNLLPDSAGGWTDWLEQNPTSAHTTRHKWLRLPLSNLHLPRPPHPLSCIQDPSHLHSSDFLAWADTGRVRSGTRGRTHMADTRRALSRCGFLRWIWAATRDSFVSSPHLFLPQTLLLSRLRAKNPFELSQISRVGTLMWGRWQRWHCHTSCQWRA